MQAPHFSQHVHDIAGPLHHLLLDLLRVEHLDVDRHVLNALVGARRGHGDVFFDGRPASQLDEHRLLLVGLEVNGGGRGRESVFDDDDAGLAWRQRDHYHALRVRSMRGPVDNDLGVSHRAHGASDLNMNCRRLRRRSDRVERQQHTRDESTHANLHSQPAQQRFSPCASAQTTTVTV